MWTVFTFAYSLRSLPHFPAYQVLQRIKELVTAEGAMRSGVSIADVAQALRVTPTVAKEELLMAELKGEPFRIMFR